MKYIALIIGGQVYRLPFCSNVFTIGSNSSNHRKLNCEGKRNIFHSVSTRILIKQMNIEESKHLMEALKSFQNNVFSVLKILVFFSVFSEALETGYVMNLTRP